MPAHIRQPRYDRGRLRAGIVHFGIGAFHRAHQAVFTEDAIELAGGDWGIVGASLLRPRVADALSEQDNLYTVETLGTNISYRVVGAIKRAFFAPRYASNFLSAIASSKTHVVTLAMSEKGYCLNTDGELDFSRPEIAADIALPRIPQSAIGWLVRGLEQRRRNGLAAAITVISCDNLQSNGTKLRDATLAFAGRTNPALRGWIRENTAYPLTLVDSIVPARNNAHSARVEAAIGLRDDASVQREEFSQWVIENKFAGPIPAWGRVGAEIVDNVDAHQRLKLHVLNTAHSALAYLGLPRGHQFVRQAIADPELSAFLDNLVEEEIAPALAPLAVNVYWRGVRARFANPMLDHRLSQISEDGSLKLPQRIFSLLIDGARTGRCIDGLSSIVRAWLDFMARTPSSDPQNLWLARWARNGANPANALDNTNIFPEAFRTDPRLRAVILVERRS